MTSPVEVWNEWSWRHKSTFLPPDILRLHCGAPAEQVRWGSPVQPSPPQGVWPQIHKQEPFHLFILLLSTGWGKTTEKSAYGKKRNFLHEPMGIPHTVFHSARNAPSSCLIKWHLVSKLAWLFSSLHHWEESNLSNWYREFFSSMVETADSALRFLRGCCCYQLQKSWKRNLILCLFVHRVNRFAALETVSGSSYEGNKMAWLIFCITEMELQWNGEGTHCGCQRAVLGPSLQPCLGAKGRMRQQMRWKC